MQRRNGSAVCILLKLGGARLCCGEVVAEQMVRICAFVWRNGRPYHGEKGVHFSCTRVAGFRDPGLRISGPLGLKSGPVLGARFRTQNWDRSPLLCNDYYKGPENGPNFGSGIWHPKRVRFSAPAMPKTCTPGFKKPATLAHENGPLSCHGAAGHSATRTHRFETPARPCGRGLALPSPNKMCIAL